jgi:hypothetical protein
MKTTVSALGLTAAVVYVMSPWWMAEFDVRKAPEAPPLSAISVVSTATDSYVAQEAITDETFDVRPHYGVGTAHLIWRLS